MNEVKRLVEQRNVDAAMYDNTPMRFAAEYGHVLIVDYLMKKPGVKVSHTLNWAFIVASENGHLNMVKYLMDLNNGISHDLNENQSLLVNPATNNNQAIVSAAMYGRLNVVQYLSTLPGVDPAAQDNRAIRGAYTRGHSSVVKYLSTCPGVHFVPDELAITCRISFQETPESPRRRRKNCFLRRISRALFG